MRRVLKIALATAAIGLGTMATPAFAAVTVVGPAATATTCLNFSFSGATETSCAGGYTGNLITGTSMTNSTGVAALSALGAGTTYLAQITNSSGFGGSGGNVIDFGTTLTGTVVIGIHYGGAGDSGGEATSFFAFNAGSGVSSITVTGRTGTQIPFGLSNAALFENGGPVPEPATWGMMLLGLAGIGVAVRRSKRRNPALLQIA